MVKIKERKGRYTFKGAEQLSYVEFIKLVAKRAGYSIAETKDIVMATFDIIPDILLNGYAIAIRNFGAFKMVKVKLAPYFVKKTGQEYSYVIKFFPKNRLREYLKENLKEKEREVTVENNDNAGDDGNE